MVDIDVDVFVKFIVRLLSMLRREFILLKVILKWGLLKLREIECLGDKVMYIRFKLFVFIRLRIVRIKEDNSL